MTKSVIYGSYDILIKVTLRIKILIHLIILVVKTALPMPWNNPITAQTEKQPVYIYMKTKVCVIIDHQ